MQGLEAWATSGLAALVKDESMSHAQAVLLLDVFYLCGCTDAGNLVLETIKKILDSGDCSVAAITGVINIGQTYGFPGLTSRGYYAMMFKPKSEWETYATRSKEEAIRNLQNLQLVDITRRLGQLVEAFLKDTPRRIGVEDTHTKLFRSHLHRVIDDLFENKFPMYFVDPAEQIMDCK